MSVWSGQAVALIGDSQMQGLRSYLPGLLRDRGATVSLTIANQGWSTERMTREGDLTSRLRAAGSPSLVVVELGGNDFSARPGKSDEQYALELRALVGQVRAGGARDIVWLGPAYSRDERVDAVHDRAAELQESLLPQLGVTWVDSRPMTRSGHRADGVHFTAAAYRTWAEAAVDALIDADPVKKERERRRRGVIGAAVGLSLAALLVGGIVAWRWR